MGRVANHKVSVAPAISRNGDGLRRPRTNRANPVITTSLLANRQDPEEPRLVSDHECLQLGPTCGPFG